MSNLQVGPLYILPDEAPQEAPCNGNTVAICDLYCTAQMDEFIAAGNDLDMIVEIETGPGIYENTTLGQAMCTRSFQLHPNSDRYDGKFECIKIK